MSSSCDERKVEGTVEDCGGTIHGEFMMSELL